MSEWETSLRQVLGNFFEHQASINAVVTFYRTARAIPITMSGAATPSEISDAGVALQEAALVQDLNPFITNYGHMFRPAAQSALLSYLDSFRYLEQHNKTPESSSEERSKLYFKHRVCRDGLHQAAVTALLCEKGYAYVTANGTLLRDSLLEVKGLI